MKLKHIFALVVGGYTLLAAKGGGGINDPVTVTLPSPAGVAEIIENVAAQTVDAMLEVSDYVKTNQTEQSTDTCSADDYIADESEQHIYRIRSVWDDPSTQIGAYSSFELAKASCPEGYTVFDENWIA